MTPELAKLLVVAVMLACLACAVSALAAVTFGKMIAERDRRERPAPSLNDVLLRCDR